ILLRLFVFVRLTLKRNHNGSCFTVIKNTRRNIFRHESSCRHDASGPDTHALQNCGSKADPDVILDYDGRGSYPRESFNVRRMSLFDDVAKMSVPRARITGMRCMVMDVHVMCDQHSISDRD